MLWRGAGGRIIASASSGTWVERRSGTPIAVVAGGVEPQRSTNRGKHGMSTMKTLARSTRAQRRGTFVTQQGRGTMKRELVSVIAIGADRTASGGSMLVDTLTDVAVRPSI